MSATATVRGRGCGAACWERRDKDTISLYDVVSVLVDSVSGKRKRRWRIWIMKVSFITQQNNPVVFQ